MKQKLISMAIILKLIKNQDEWKLVDRRPYVKKIKHHVLSESRKVQNSNYQKQDDNKKLNNNKKPKNRRGRKKNAQIKYHSTINTSGNGLALSTKFDQFINNLNDFPMLPVPIQSTSYCESSIITVNHSNDTNNNDNSDNYNNDNSDNYNNDNIDHTNNSDNYNNDNITSTSSTLNSDLYKFITEIAHCNEKYYHILIAQEINDIETLSMMTDDNYKELNILLGSRVKIINALKNYKS